MLETETQTEQHIGKQTFQFKSDEAEILKLVTHSLYSNKEIFVRELISNAFDAADKLQFSALSQAGLLENEPELKIWVDFDETARTITIRDNGIGMSWDEVVENLGTIARSGTKQFLNQLSADQKENAQLIGQFGVGFYSAFIVSDSVTVRTRRAGLPADQGVQWTSTGEGKYEIEPIHKTARGTEIILHLQAEQTEFLNAWRLREIIKKYSDHITLPIVMKKEAQPEYDEKGELKPQTEPAPIIEEVVNRATALWALPKSDIKDEQYQELYKHIAHDFEAPLAWSHNRVEGNQEYTSLIYIPGRAPFDLWQPNKARGLKLYVQRVFIMDDAEQFLPHYLRFVKGVIDSKDLPLNISREILQNNRLVDNIKSGLTKRILSLLETLAQNEPEKYKAFWKQFGQVLKEGPAEDFVNKAQIAKLLRFATTHNNQETQEQTLSDYVSRMVPEQDKIYYVTAETFNAAKNSPHLEIFKQKKIEVLLLSDRVDEWLVTHLSEFELQDKKYHFESVAKGSLDLGKLQSETEKEIQKQAETEYQTILEKTQKILGDKVKSVRLTHRLTESPSCIVVESHDMSMQMERLMKSAGQAFPTTKPILELNPEHAMVQKLKAAESEDAQFSDLAFVLFEQAILSEGGHLDDPAMFVARMNRLLLQTA